MVKIGVVGSISTDFVVTSQRRPMQGETIFGDNFQTNFGGKGANQAVAASRLGGETFMFGAVGDDKFGDSLIENLDKNQIHCASVKRVEGVPSGSAVINVVEGDNSIIYVAGANATYSAQDVLKDRSLLAELDVILVQNETAEETIEALIDLADELQITLIYNPAPARDFSESLLNKVFCITPNETEFEVMFKGRDMNDVLQQYPGKIVVTLGENGARFHNGTQIIDIPAQSVSNVVDTTGAGDTFNGAFAVAIGSKLSMEDSLKFANLASSMSIQKAGAQNGIPTLEELKASDYFEETWHIK